MCELEGYRSSHCNYVLFVQLLVLVIAIKNRLDFYITEMH